MEPRYDEATAYHEAGHAVLALALGQPVRRVSVSGGALAMRDLMDGLRQGGVVTGGQTPMTPKDYSRFLSKLDDAVSALHRAHPSER